MLDQDCLLSLSGLRLIYVSLNRGYKCSKFAPPTEMQCFDRLYLFLTEDLNAPKLLPQLRCNALVACTSFNRGFESSGYRKIRRYLASFEQRGPNPSTEASSLLMVFWQNCAKNNSVAVPLQNRICPWFCSTPSQLR